MTDLKRIEVGFVGNQVITLKEAGVELIDSEARIGLRGSRVAFLHPKSTGSVLTELVEPAADHE